MPEKNIEKIDAGFPGFSVAMRDAMLLMENEFIENERKLQNEIFIEKRKSENFSVTGFEFSEGASARFHTDDIDEIIRLDNLNAENDENLRGLYGHFESLAQYRHRSEFLKLLIENFDRFVDAVDKKNLIHRQECKETLVGVQKLYDGWIADYKTHLLMSQK
ncbi:MAG: hypothetical protein FWD19_04300 [Defluviitaleaceae bacterium]|nr:hypothetical protein [Defluviitaleaceae bacterium]